MCSDCFDKQLIIDRQFEEIQRLKQKLKLNERKLSEGFFGLSTPSSQIPVKTGSLAENQARRGGAQIGHHGHGRQSFTCQEADERRILEVEAETCPSCQCQLVGHSSNERAIYDLNREQVRKLYYEMQRKRCPQCRRTVSGKDSNAMPKAMLSNDLITEVAEQHYVLGRTLGQVEIK